MSDLEIVMHYAVWKTFASSMVPACLTREFNDLAYDKRHGITINRGDVDCATCRRMMDGLTVEQWCRWEMQKEFRKFLESKENPLLWGDGFGGLVNPEEVKDNRTLPSSGGGP